MFDVEQMRRDVQSGLAATPRRLPSKYFYDERGSQLFDEITRLPEYYPTNAERALLAHHAPAIVDTARPRTLVELGSGSSEKTRLLLDQLLQAAPDAATYLPIDVSADFLTASAIQLRAQYPKLNVVPVVADFSTDLVLPDHPLPTLHAFLGSTIGNFVPDTAVALLSSVERRMMRDDWFLLGIDLRKTTEMVERAYNDSRGITAAFNRNMLAVINQALGADFDLDAFDHSAIYNDVDHRIEMRLVARSAQLVNIPGMAPANFAAGDSIITEFSYKYDRAGLTELLGHAGLTLRRWFDDDGTFALALATR